MSFGARAIIRLEAIRHNFKTIKSRISGAKVLAVIKANAYGHGLIPVAQALSDADCFAVARFSEAIALRHAGIRTPIAVLSGLFAEKDLATAVEFDLQLGVHTESQVEWLEHYGNAGLVVWLKIDTGMNRLGFRVGQASATIERLRRCPSVAELRVMTHFANADDVQDARTRIQLAAFGQVIAQFTGDVSVANSSGILGWEEELVQFFAGRASGSLWARPGLALYGVSPFGDRCGADLGLVPAMQFVSRLIAVKPIAAGDLVGYGGTWRAGQDTVLGIVAAGYGDGYSRFIPAGTPVIVNDRRVPVAGLVSMDLTAVDLGPGAVDKVGDTVLLWGAGLPVEEIAGFADTIPYQLLCGVSNRDTPEFER